MGKKSRGPHKVYLFKAQGPQQDVHSAGPHGKDLGKKSHQYDSGEKIGGKDDSLDAFFETVKETVVNAEGQQDGKGKSRNQTVNVDYQGIPQDKEKIRGTKEPLKVIKAHPGTIPDPQPGLEAFKGHQDAVYGNVIKDCHINHGDEEQNIETPGVPAAMPDTCFMHRRLRPGRVLRKEKFYHVKKIFFL
jgi:hypothetical protein